MVCLFDSKIDSITLNTLKLEQDVSFINNFTQPCLCMSFAVHRVNIRADARVQSPRGQKI